MTFRGTLKQIDVPGLEGRLSDCGCSKSGAITFLYGVCVVLFMVNPMAFAGENEAPNISKYLIILLSISVYMLNVILQQRIKRADALLLIVFVVFSAYHFMTSKPVGSGGLVYIYTAISHLSALCLYLVAASCSNIKNMRAFFYAVIFLFVVINIEGLIYIALYLMGSSYYELFVTAENRFGGSFTQFNGAIYLLALIFAVFYANMKPGGVVSKVVLILSFFLILLTLERSYYLSLLVFIVMQYLVFSDRRNSLNVLLVIGGVVLLMFVLMAVLREGASESGSAAIGSIVVRLAKNLKLVEGVIANNWVAGVGPGQSGFYLAQVQTLNFFFISSLISDVDFGLVAVFESHLLEKSDEEVLFAKSHNTILDMVADYGLLGWLLLLVIGARLAGDFVKVRRMQRYSGGQLNAESYFVFHAYKGLVVLVFSLIPSLLLLSWDTRLYMVAFLFGMLAYFRKGADGALRQVNFTGSCKKQG